MSLGSAETPARATPGLRLLVPLWTQICRAAPETAGTSEAVSAD